MTAIKLACFVHCLLFVLLFNVLFIVHCSMFDHRDDRHRDGTADYVKIRSTCFRPRSMHNRLGHEFLKRYNALHGTI